MADDTDFPISGCYYESGDVKLENLNLDVHLNIKRTEILKASL